MQHSHSITVHRGEGGETRIFVVDYDENLAAGGPREIPRDSWAHRQILDALEPTSTWVGEAVEEPLAVAEAKSPESARLMLEVGVEGNLFHPHPETDHCKDGGCRPLEAGQTPDWTGSYSSHQRCGGLPGEEVSYGGTD